MADTSGNNRELTFSVTLLVILLSILFGANTVAVKTAFKGFGIYTSAGIRFIIASIVISLWARFTGRPILLKEGQLKHVAFLSLVFALQLGIFYLGLANTFASRATLIMNMQPFILLVLAHFFIPGDTITVKKTISMMLGFTGVAFLFSEGLSSGVKYGDFAVLATATLWAVNATYTKRIIDEFRPFQLVLYPMYFAGPLFLLTGLVIDEPVFKMVNGPILFAMFYQTIVTASFGFIMWNSLLKTYKATSVHNFVFIMPISGVIASHIFLKETITENVIISLLFIISGIVLLQYRLYGLKP